MRKWRYIEIRKKRQIRVWCDLNKMKIYKTNANNCMGGVVDKALIWIKICISYVNKLAKDRKWL